MKKIHKSALVTYSPEQMFLLVDDIDAYADFLPWCSNSNVIERTDEFVKGNLEISYGSLNKSFVTKNINTLHSQIEMQLVEGPFKHLLGLWSFKALGGDGCKIELNMEFEFSNKLIDMTVGPVFSKIANSLVDAFTERAKSIYG
ncbi:Ribosome association toxin RatA [hydrothermal vent metagenome]|uniref:Ribosome association toxin RatA n=1 Tax=hydrothermal vent metagenome TaxID=652676 RepID=A0A3B0ZTZ1_9ZZZZ